MSDSSSKARDLPQLQDLVRSSRGEPRGKSPQVSPVSDSRPQSLGEDPGALREVPKIEVIDLGGTVDCFYSDITSSNLAAFAIVIGYSGGDPATTQPRYQRFAGPGWRWPTLIAINSTAVLRALEEISGIQLPSRPWVMGWPFKMFLGFSPQIEEKLNHLKNLRPGNEETSADTPTTRPSVRSDEEASRNEPDDIQWTLELLASLMNSHLQELSTLQASFAGRTAETTSFDTLWFLFRPGCIVVLGPENQSSSRSEQAYRLLHVDYQPALLPGQSQRKFQLHCLFIGFGDDQFETRKTSIEIPWFWGEVSINQLPAFPIKYSKRGNLGSVLASRGDGFLRSLYGAGIYQNRTDPGGSNEFFVDFKAALQDDPSLGDALEGRRGSTPYIESTCSSTKPSDYSFWPSESLRTTPFLYDDRMLDRRLGEIYGQCKAVSFSNDLPSPELDSIYLMLLPPRLPGFSFQTKSWKLLDVNHFQKRDIEKDETDKPFEQPMLPPGYAEILRSAVLSRRDAFRVRDAATGYGMRGCKTNPGVVILLHGPPGCGMTDLVKTTAAAAKPRRPLYQITCADLSSSPELFKRDLLSHLTRAERWDCIVLLEDAEIYLSERDENMDKSRIVSIFLQALDDLRGTMFLTSTRVGLIDEALKPRIHIALSIPTMNQNKAKASWVRALRSVEALYASKITIDFESIVSWAMGRYEKRSIADGTWSYRQIYNAIDTAMILATWEFGSGHSTSRSEIQSEEQPPLPDEATERNANTIVLSATHFSFGERLTQGFNSYLEECRGKDEERATEFHLRAPADHDSADGTMPRAPGQRNVHNPSSLREHGAKLTVFPRPSWNYGDEYTEADRYDDDYNYDEEDKFGYYRSPPRGQRGPPPRSILKHRGSPPPPQIGPRTIPQNSGSRVTINVRPQRRESGSEDEEEYERDASSDIIDREQYKQPSAASEGGDDSNDDQKAGDAVPAEEELKAAKRGTEETSGATKKDESRGTDEA